MPGRNVTLVNSPERMPLEGLLTIPDLVGLRRGKITSPYNPGLRSLISQLPDGVALSIVATEGTISAMALWPELAKRRDRLRFIPISDDSNPSFWCQDEFMAGSRGTDERPILIRSAVAKRAEDAAVAEAVGRATGIEVVRSDVAFEGGNALVGDDFILVGADAWAGFARGPDLDNARQVHFVGTRSPMPPRRLRLTEGDHGPIAEEINAGTGRRQPVFHLDAFVTLAGRGGDGRYRVLLGDPRLAADLTGDSRLQAAAEALAPPFDEVADWFAARPEFMVIRNPLPVIFSEHNGLLSWSRQSIAREFAGVDGADEVLSAMSERPLKRIAVRRWYFATQNSAITLEDADGERTVLLPTYAAGRWRCLAPAEECNAAVWRELGFRVVELGDFHAFAQHHGSAHCVFKVLARR
jgi:hypothetical protein